MRIKIDWSKEKLETLVKQTTSVAECLRAMGLRHGSSHNTFWKYVDKYGIDTSHFEGPNSSKTRKLAQKTKKLSTAELLVEWEPNSSVKTHTVKKRILKENLLEYECALCGLKDVWNGQAITLHLDHINGVNTDNRLENLRFLCPNCHSQTDTYCGRNSDHGPVKAIKDNHCIDCGEPIKWAYAQRCNHCAGKLKMIGKGIDWPDIPTLLQMIKDLGGFVQAGRALGVSDNAIRKHMRSKGFTPPKIRGGTGQA